MRVTAAALLLCVAWFHLKSWKSPFNSTSFCSNYGEKDWLLEESQATKNIARYLLRSSPCDNSCVRHYQISGHPFFSKVFGVWGLISKRMGNDTYCGKNWIWFYIWLHVVLLDLNLIQSHISTNSWLGIELAKSDLKGCLAKLLFEGLWDLFKSLYWNVTFEHSTWHWFT